MATSNVKDWTIPDVEKWLQKNGFPTYVYLLCKTHKIDGKALLLLTESDIKGEIEVLGDVKRMMIGIRLLQKLNYQAYHELSGNGISQDVVKRHIMPNNFVNRPQLSRYDSVDSVADCPEISQEADEPDVGTEYGVLSKLLDAELWKVVLSFIYVFFVFLLTSLVMVIVHDRVPDMNKYPPLPDIFLDNIPLIPWAFEACEGIALTLSTIWILILIFHKHRFILLRRMFSLLGTVFLLRCVTMLITSLSVPGIHLQCEARPAVGIKEQLYKALTIWQGLGMSMQGVRSCGDYMFSGHTCCLTMLNFFITEYTPRRMYYVHTTSWVLNLFGIFFILAAHEHYSIDVFIAFYISSRLFLYYHTLANNRSLMMRDRNRTRVWFPLFTFFESRCDGIVPNEYEWPLSWAKTQKVHGHGGNGNGNGDKVKLG
ncbi:sphingomyelin synthase-related protein 1-like [Lineus longissimus]|uniref:sphingomyelin synthase-related protein 1-like n=1 Tax=Lineus longissimus TaxID=88925 RepID=UPI002B4FA0EF